MAEPCIEKIKKFINEVNNNKSTGYDSYLQK